MKATNAKKTRDEGKMVARTSAVSDDNKPQKVGLVRYRQKRFGIVFDVMLADKCIITSFRVGDKVFKGVAKCNPEDAYDKRIGTLLAMKRTMNAYSGETVHILRNLINQTEANKKNYCEAIDKIVFKKPVV